MNPDNLSETEDNTLMICSFQLGQQNFGVPVKHLLEIRPASQLTTVPGAPPFLAGLVNIRGELLTVLDLAGVLGCGHLTQGNFLAHVTWQDQYCCLRIDSAGEVLEIPLSELETLPEQTESSLKRLCSAFWPHFDAGMMLLEVQALFPPYFLNNCQV